MELKTLRQKVKGLTDGGEDRGVSPVIGVILMVAITVILAAVIGAFVLGLGDDIGTNVQAGASVTADADAGTLTTTYSSTQNADYLTVSINGERAYSDGASPPSFAPQDSTYTNEVRLESVGSTQTFDVGPFGVGSDEEYSVLVVAHTSSGDSTVIIDTTRRTSASYSP